MTGIMVAGATALRMGMRGSTSMVGSLGMAGSLSMVVKASQRRGFARLSAGRDTGAVYVSARARYF